MAGFIGGFVAAEGSFVRVGEPPTFRFSVGLGAVDTISCHQLHDFLGCGRVHCSPRRKPHYDDEVIFVISAMGDHLAATIPFMDAHLPSSYKRQQYLRWRDEVLDYWQHRARRRHPCTIEGCELPVKADGLCRPRLWEHRRR